MSSFRFVAILAFTLAVFTTQRGQSDELEAISPVINEQTLAVACIDLNGIDLAELQKQYFDPLVQLDEARIGVAIAVAQAQEIISQLRADGAKHIYLVVTGTMSPQLELNRIEESIVRQLPFVAIPGAKTETLKAIQTRLDPKNKLHLRVGEVRGVAVIAFEKLFEAIASQKSQPRPDIAAAMAAAGDRPVRLAVVPPAIFARAAEEILLDPIPGMKEPLGKILARGAKWISVGIEPKFDRFAAQLVIKSDDVAAAKRLEETMRIATGLIGGKMLEGGQAESILGTAVFGSMLPVADGDRLTLTVNRERAAGLYQLATMAARLSGVGTARPLSQNNLKQIALGMLNYEDRKRTLPDRAIRDQDGKPLLSWRVAILPFVDEGVLYNEFHLDEPWDSEHNRKLIEKMPKFLRNPDSWEAHLGRTRYLAAVGEKLAFPPDRAIRLAEINDGTSNTILVVEADRDHAVIWTKPDDLKVDLTDPKRGLTDGTKSFNAAFADGSVRLFRGTFDTEQLRRRFTRAGGETVNE